MSSDLLVCGLGPAGRALAHRALARGLSVTVVDPNPDRAWTATYAAWADELPTWLPPNVIATTTDNPTAWAERRIELRRPYAVLDTPALQHALPLSGARIIADRVAEIPRPQRNRPQSARLLTGTTLTASRVIDARGLPRSPAHAEQTAYGLIVGRDRCADTETLFMDWRLDNGASPAAPRSFLYAVPLTPDTVLLEETCLAGRPALDPAELRTRLHHRLRSRGIEFTDHDRVERVRFPVQGGTPGRRTFGAAGALTHPATGYSVATSLRTADAVAAGESIWPPAARAVHALRLAGLRALLALPPRDLPLFFDTFFTLPAEQQRAYLSGRDDLRATAAAMTTLFTALPWRLRRTLALATLGTRASR
ncbi:lycopene cyclase [Nocardia uniformis]|uniref:Lycopene cyclase n=1 Tax=Nocardia uniformis TaxID=53432 RepID=A0A849BX61_9NOCA|nr:lycopene cyclase family protein [Nocardia uniformis]NNH68297.1 lycopene cyclase [Nocardia uniformis]